MVVRDVTPMLAVADIDTACRFMADCLGFETQLQTDRHAYCASGGGAVRFIRAAPGADMDDPARQVAIYIDVDDVDAHYAAHKAALDALPAGLFRAPFEQDYGQREFHVIHGAFLFFVGQKSRKEAKE